MDNKNTQTILIRAFEEVSKAIKIQDEERGKKKRKEEEERKREEEEERKREEEEERKREEKERERKEEEERKREEEEEEKKNREELANHDRGKTLSLASDEIKTKIEKAERKLKEEKKKFEYNNPYISHNYLKKKPPFFSFSFSKNQSSPVFDDIRNIKRKKEKGRRQFNIFTLFNFKYKNPNEDENSVKKHLLSMKKLHKTTKLKRFATRLNENTNKIIEITEI